jgi:hypothetical protein
VAKRRAGMIAAAALLVLKDCNGESPEDHPQAYMIDQDIRASHGTGIPTALTPKRRGFEKWRHDDP